jgi:hypothetical protein
MSVDIYLDYTSYLSYRFQISHGINHQRKPAHFGPACTGPWCAVCAKETYCHVRSPYRRHIDQPGHRAAGFAPDFLFPDWDPAVLEQHKALMIPQCFDEAQGRLISSIHTWVLKTAHRTILIDSCAGNHKNGPALPRFHQLNLPFLERLAEAGVSTMFAAPISMPIIAAGTRGWSTAAGCRHFRMPDTCSPRPSMNTATVRPDAKVLMPGSTRTACCPLSKAGRP